MSIYILYQYISYYKTWIFLPRQYFESNYRITFVEKTVYIGQYPLEKKNLN